MLSLKKLLYTQRPCMTWLLWNIDHDSLDLKLVHKIWIEALPSITFPSHSTHLLQLLDVCIFLPAKHYFSDAVNQAIFTGEETFSGVEFLAAFNSFRKKAFKSSTILSAWKKTGLIPFDPESVLGIVRKPLPPPREEPPSCTPLAEWNVRGTYTSSATSRSPADAHFPVEHATTVCSPYQYRQR